MNPHKLPFIGKLGKSVKSLKRLDERGLLYEMDYYANYKPFLKMADKLVTSAGCSTFTTWNEEGERLMCRNYDFSHYRFGDKKDKNDITGLDIILHVKSKTAKYKSVGIADGYWLGVKSGTFFEGVPEDGKTDISLMAFLPFICMDGMNDQGLTVSIMFLPTPTRWDETEYVDPDALDEKARGKAIILTEAGQLPDPENLMVEHGVYTINTADKKAWQAYKKFSVWQKDPNKKTVYHTVLMRMMLDDCKNVEEAVKMAETVNMRSPMPDSDYHILVGDASGKTVVLEWVDNVLKVVEADHSTNFYLSKECEKKCDRYEVLDCALAEKKGKMTEEEGMKVLQDASQDHRAGRRTGFTQWSVVYNMAKKTGKVSIFVNYDKTYEFKL